MLGEYIKMEIEYMANSILIMDLIIMVVLYQIILKDMDN
jgi:hypothetical protein